MTKEKSDNSGRPGPEATTDQALYVGASVNLSKDKTVVLARRVCGLVAPPPKLTVSQWADERRILPQTSAEPGKWRTDRTPYLREPMDACSDPSVKKIVLIFASQTGKSECELNIAGYFIDYDPSTILIIQPTVEMAQAFSKDRIAPMISDCPSLSEKVGDPRSRNTSNTILHKEYPGGTITIIGANAPAPLASRFIRVVLADEVDRFPISAGTEGDPLKLAEIRQTTFWNALSVVVSTPTIKGESRIEAEYENSTQEEWCVPCPSCGEYQPYAWGRLVFDSVQMACQECGAMHGEYEWKAGEGKWIATAEHANTRGFRINAMASPWCTWSSLIEEFKDAKAKGVETLKTFVNTRLAESWEEHGEGLKPELLADRRHEYHCDVPELVNFITCGVDVQRDRLEYEVVGWGPGKESWGIEYGMIAGDPQQNAVWLELDALIQKQWERADGVILPISCTAVDSGYATSSVYAFTKPRTARYVFAVKGVGGPDKPVVGKHSWVGKNNKVAMWPVGTDATKDLTYSRLCIDEPGPDYCHFPLEEESSSGRRRGYDEGYFEGLYKEKRVERISKGRRYHVWVKKSSHSRNEPLDCRGYATAALEIRNPDLNKVAKVVGGASGDAGGKQARRRRGYKVLSAGIQV